MGSCQNIEIKLYWTNTMSENAIYDFILTHNKVFKSDFRTSRFKKKYIDNIYGPSLIVLAYTNNTCVGVRAFWRNDVNGIKAYQPCDTGVLEKYRGMGLFTEMTKKALESVEEGSLIYNFPNDNSLPGYLKMGWNIQSIKRYKLFNAICDYGEIDKIDNHYLKWLVNDTDSYFKELLFYTKINKKYFLVKKRKYNLYLIIGEMGNENIKYLSKARRPLCICYSSKGYLGRGIVTVVKNLNKDVRIPIYKIDTLF